MWFFHLYHCNGNFGPSFPAGLCVFLAVILINLKSFKTKLILPFSNNHNVALPYIRVSNFLFAELKSTFLCDNTLFTWRLHPR